MSDGMSDSRREEREASEIEIAAEVLAEALEGVYAAFGLHAPGALEIANRVLKRAKVKLVVLKP